MTTKSKMCIIGFGRMGKRCAKLFSDGFQVEVISGRDIRSEAWERGAEQSNNSTKSLSEADFIFLAVPIEALDLWTPRIDKFSKPDCVVIDCCTVRHAANEKLCDVQRKRFGLPELGAPELPVDGEPDKRISDYLEQRGCRLYPINVGDTGRKPVAGLAHFIGMTLDLNLTADERSRMEKSGACRYLLQLIEHLKSNSPATYKETQLLNPSMSDRRKEFIAWLKQLDEELDRGIFEFKSHPPDKWRE